MMQFKTDNLELFQDMVTSAVEKGLQFKAYQDSWNNYIIDYTGGF